MDSEGSIGDDEKRLIQEVIYFSNWLEARFGVPARGQHWSGKHTHTRHELSHHWRLFHINPLQLATPGPPHAEANPITVLITNDEPMERNPHLLAS